MGTPYRRGSRGYPARITPGTQSAFTIGAKRDQYGQLLRESAVPPGKMSADHDWTAFDNAFGATHHAPVTTPGKTVATNTSNALNTGADALQSAFAMPGGPAAAAVMKSAAPATKQVIPPTNVEPPATRQTLDGRTEYLDPQTGRYVQSTGPDRSSAPPARGLDKNLVQPTKTVVAKPIPAPVTSPNGNATTDAANLAQNQALYAPGGTTTTPGAATTAFSAPNPTAVAAAGTGQNVATKPGDVAMSTVAPSSAFATKGIPGIPWTQTASGMPGSDVGALKPGEVQAKSGIPGIPETNPVPATNPQDEEKRRQASAFSRGGAL